MEQTNHGATATRAVAQAANQPIAFEADGAQVTIEWHQLCVTGSRIHGGDNHGQKCFWHEVVVIAPDTSFRLNFHGPKILDEKTRELVKDTARGMYLRNK